MSMQLILQNFLSFDLAFDTVKSIPSESLRYCLTSLIIKCYQKFNCVGILVQTIFNRGYIFKAK